MACADISSTLVKPSIVNAYKGEPEASADSGEDGLEPTALQAVPGDSFLPDPSGGAKGRCLRCKNDETVSAADKEVLRTRSQHAVHVKMGDGGSSDRTFHSPGKQLLRFLAMKGLEIKSGESCKAFEVAWLTCSSDVLAAGSQGRPRLARRRRRSQPRRKGVRGRRVSCDLSCEIPLQAISWT